MAFALPLPLGSGLVVVVMVLWRLNVGRVEMEGLALVGGELRDVVDEMVYLLFVLLIVAVLLLGPSNV